MAWHHSAAWHGILPSRSSGAGSERSCPLTSLPTTVRTIPGSGPACEDNDSKVVDAMIAKSPCAAQYNALEECLVRTERDWTKCQDVVKALSVCSSAAANR